MANGFDHGERFRPWRTVSTMANGEHIIKVRWDKLASSAGPPFGIVEKSAVGRRGEAPLVPPVRCPWDAALKLGAASTASDRRMVKVRDENSYSVDTPANSMETSVSFLDSLRSDPDDQRWRMLIDLYSPLIRGWLVRSGAQSGDVDDLTQDVLMVIVRRFPEFRRQEQPGAFRSWIRTIAVNCLRDHWKRGRKQPHAPGGTDFAEVIDQLSDPQSELSQLWDREHNERVSGYLLSRVRTTCSPSTWQAFQRFALDGLAADEVAKELGMTANAVFIAKSRVMSALRKLGQGLID